MEQMQFLRTRMLMGDVALQALKTAKVAVFGVGGVGGYAVEVLARSGVGEIHLIDSDRVCITNINRQIIALHSTIGRLKVDVAEERIHDINPGCIVKKYPIFFLPENAGMVDLKQFDYVVDCIDTVTAKLFLVKRCHELGVPIISSMGAANKMDATAFRVTDIFKTKMDPLAKVMRQKLRQWGIGHLKVVYSEEAPRTPLPVVSPTVCPAAAFCPDAPTCPDNGKAAEGIEGSVGSVGSPKRKRAVPASNAFVPAAAGLIVGGEVVKELSMREIGSLEFGSLGDF